MSTDSDRSERINRRTIRNRDTEGGDSPDYTPANAVSMVDQATIDYFKKQNPNLPFNDPKGYYDWMYGGGSVVPSSNPAQDAGQYFSPSSGNTTQFANQPLNYNASNGFTDNAWMLPLGVVGAGLAYGGLAGANAGGAAAGGFEGAGMSDLAMEMAPGITQDFASGTLANLGATEGAGSFLQNPAYEIFNNGVVDPMSFTGAEAGLNGASAAFPAGMSTSSGGGFWDNLFSTVTKGLGSNGGKSVGGNLISGLLEAYGQNKLSGDMKDIAERSAMLADPFRDQRGFYQDELKKSYTDPNFLQNNPTFQAMMNPAMDRVRATAAAKGFNGSGNLLNDVVKVGTQTAAQYLQPWQQQTAMNAGANFGPGNAASVYSQGAQAGAQAGQGVGAGLGYAFSPLLSSIFKNNNNTNNNNNSSFSFGVA